MPEGPELYLASKYVNTCCKGLIFTGKVLKNPVHKSSDVDFECPAYTIAAASRGKEMQLTLTKLGPEDKKKLKKDIKDVKKSSAMESSRILFRFGMSGNFQFTGKDDIHKHSHLRFFTNDNPPMVLSYVDVRRFGRWEVDADWSKDRGPDPMFDYLAFRSNVVSSLKSSAFDQPICEAMLNQKYFNGIGNYLRAEILYRLKIPPFERARTVLDGLPEEPPDVKPLKKGKGGTGKKGGAEPDFLHLCHTVPLEVIAIGAGGYTADGKASDYSDFMKWLQCYYKHGMSNMVDHNGRTIWYHGPAGPMAPKGGKSRTPTKRKKKTEKSDASVPSKVKKEEMTDEKEQKGKKTSRRKVKVEAQSEEDNSELQARKKTATRKKSSPKVAKDVPPKTRASRKASKTDEKDQMSDKSKSKGSGKNGNQNASEVMVNGKPAKKTFASKKKAQAKEKGEVDKNNERPVTSRGKRKGVKK